jgi:hypothetical protein
LEFGETSKKFFAPPEGFDYYFFLTILGKNDPGIWVTKIFSRENRKMFSYFYFEKYFLLDHTILYVSFYFIFILFL